MEAIRMHAEITLVENDRLSKLARTTSIEAEPEAVITCLQYVPRLELYHEGSVCAAV